MPSDMDSDELVHACDGYRTYRDYSHMYAILFSLRMQEIKTDISPYIFFWLSYTF